MDIGILIKNECRIETSCCVTQRQTLTTLSDVSHEACPFQISRVGLRSLLVYGV